MFQENRFRPSRRTVLTPTSGAVPAGTGQVSTLPASTVDVGAVKDGRVNFPPIVSGSEAAPNSDRTSLPPEKRIGFAVVALGRLSVEEVLPAFAATKKCRLTALCSGSPEKLNHLGMRYGLPTHALYNYDDFERIAENREVQVVYIVPPNLMDKDWVLRSAAAKKHVLCEKPMATSPKDAQLMITACVDANVKLMIAYRCRYQPHHLELIRRVQTGEFGPPKIIEAINAQNQGDPNQ
jgi:predicted dehydrogenase